MKRYAISLMAVAVLGLAGCQSGNVNGLVAAGQSLATAALLSDADAHALGDRTISQYDSKEKVAAKNSKYAKRLAQLTKNWRQVDGKSLEYKVYLKPDVNAFAVPNGSIRIYSGLMDAMSDDELRYVIAHEIGHVVLGHSKNALQVAYGTSAVRQAIAASGSSTAAALSQSALGALGEKLVNAQFSQKQENEADDFALQFLQRNQYKTGGAVTALRKLESKYGNNSTIFSSHPAPGARAARLEQKLR